MVTENTNFFISVGVQDEKGLQINNDYKRHSARFNYDAKLRKNMNVGVKFNGNWTKFVYALEDGFTDDDPGNTAGFDTAMRRSRVSRPTILQQITMAV